MELRGEGEYCAGRALSAMITFYSKEGLGLREGDWKILAIGMNPEWMAKRKWPPRFYPNQPFPASAQ